MKPSKLDNKFDTGKEDILQHFDVSHVRKLKAKTKRTKSSLTNKPDNKDIS